jgi:hypothetical protein
MRHIYKPKHPRLIATGSSILTFIILGVIIIHDLTAPVHGTIIHTTAGLKVIKASQTPIVAPDVTSKNSYFSLTLPAGFTPQANSATPAGLLFYEMSLKHSLDGTLIVSITVKNLPPGGVSGDSSFETRVVQPTQYQASSISVAGDMIAVSSATVNDGVVAFWPHKSYEATISVTTGLGDGGSGSQSDELATIKQIIAGWEWLQ